MLSKLVATISLGMLVLAGSPAYAGIDPGDLCKEKKAKAAGKKAFDILKAFGKNQKKPNVSKLTLDISKAQSKFTKGFTKTESGGLCVTSGDSDAIEAKVDVFLRDVMAEINRFVDNGDGTITDNQTGLMWEKKSEDGGLHDKDNYYVWAGCCDGDCGFPWDPNRLCQPNPAAASACSTRTGGAVGCSECSVGTCDVDPLGLGASTTIWDWLGADMNQPPGFAGYNDWRIPETNQDGGVEELDSLINLSQAGPPCIFDEFKAPCSPGCVLPACSCTASGSSSYWSSSTLSSLPVGAWVMNFANGYVLDYPKFVNFHVRAVRGGSPSTAFLDVTSGVLD